MELQTVSEHEEEGTRKISSADLVEQLVLSIGRQARSSPHPLLYVNLGFLIPVIFACGVLYQRILNLDERVAKLQGAETLATKIEVMNNEVNRLRDRLDRFLDQTTISKQQEKP